ncbi:MAG: ABC transporter ATP-binding protein [Candidatus Cyclobacteriaceae bacterium M2_1C_046]
MAKRRGREPLEPADKRKLNKENFKKLRKLFSYMLPYKAPFITGLICLLFSSLLLLSFPYLAGQLLDLASGKESWVADSIKSIAFILFGILFLQAGVSFGRVYLFARVSERAMADIRENLYHQMVILPMTFFDKRRVGELISRVTSDVTLLQDTFSITLAELIRQLATLIIGTAVIFVIAPKLSLFMLAIVPVLVILAITFGTFIRRLSKQTQDTLANANIIVEETLQSISMVKAFTNELFESRRYRKALDESVTIALKAATYRGGFISFVIFSLFGSIVAVLWFGAVQVQNGDLSIGDLLSFVLYTTFIGGSIAGLGDLYGQLQRAIGASERVLEILDEDKEPIKKDAAPLDIKGAIEYQNIGFSYPTRPEVKVLKNISFKIAPGEKAALVGPSGAGKSTIIQLLLRFYRPQDGDIKIDGQELNELDLHRYRNNVGIVPQEVILFGGTIRENIAYGNPDASEEQITDAAKKANAWEFIEKFPEGLGTMVGERGIKLSGGQRQRIAIARAILKDPAILILDEATSSLDAHAELLVQQALDKLMEGRTTLIIAHRLATIRKVNKIFVLKEGQIIEAGSHEELSTSEDGLYKNLLKLQFQLN